MLIPQSRRLEQLRRTAESIIDLSDDVDPERDHIRGDPDGAVTLVEYADFECPYCGRAEPTIRELLDMHHERRPALRLPPPAAAGRPPARPAGGGGERGGGGAGRLLADARHADGAPGGTRPRRRPPLRRRARTRRRPSSKRRCATRVYLSRVAEDVASADTSGVSGTPTFFINGRRHQGVYDIEALTKAISRARKCSPTRKRKRWPTRSGRRKRRRREREKAGRPDGDAGTTSRRSPSACPRWPRSRPTATAPGR